MKRVLKVFNQQAEVFEKVVFVSGLSFTKEVDTRPPSSRKVREYNYYKKRGNIPSWISEPKPVPTGMIKFTFDIKKDEIKKLERVQRMVPFRGHQEIRKYVLSKIPNDKILIRKESIYGACGYYAYIYTGSEIKRIMLYQYIKDTSPTVIDDVLAKMKVAK